MFIHLTEVGSGQIVAQHDGFDAFIPQLEIGDQILQRHALALPEEFDNQGYELRLGLYQRQGSGRWTVDGQGVDTFSLGAPNED